MYSWVTGVFMICHHWFKAPASLFQFVLSIQVVGPLHYVSVFSAFGNLFLANTRSSMCYIFLKYTLEAYLKPFFTSSGMLCPKVAEKYSGRSCLYCIADFLIYSFLRKQSYLNISSSWQSFLISKFQTVCFWLSTHHKANCLGYTNSQSQYLKFVLP